MDYKDTLNLPRTGFPMKADLIAREPERLNQWRENKLYENIQAHRQSGKKFVLHDGPPFTNGDVHIGTALNKVLKDIIIRFATLQGFQAPYIPGWDTHGLPIEFKVSQELRKSGNAQTDPASIRRACEAYARKYKQIQETQFQRLGILGDWANPYITLDRHYEADELRLFADIIEQGFVYRGKKPVYWSIPARTALAEAEVEYKDHISQSVYVKFPVLGQHNTFILIWTTTPWTLPANLAIAYNSAFSYSLIRAGEESYILSTLLLPTVAEKCGWESYQIIRSLDASLLEPLQFQHPFIHRTGLLFPGDAFVENNTGTGFVHIAPGHGLEDYSLGQQHGLPIYSPVNDEGRFALTNDLPAEQQMPPELIGKSILEKNNKSEANDAVLELLRQHQRLVHQEDYPHSYPHCWRSKTPVIFRAMDQWFIRIDHDQFRERVLQAIERVQWIPESGRNRVEAAVKARPDWCISRQRAWGVPIPAFYDADKQPILDPEIVRNAARLIEEQGANIWFEKTASELWAAVKPASWSGPDPVEKGHDTLDVWIDSGSSSRAVLMRRPELQHGPNPEEASGLEVAALDDRSGSGKSQIANRKSPFHWQADIYLEGSDQARGWFQSSLLLSLAGNGAAPYKKVLTHGFMVDTDRVKISKSQLSQDSYEKPQTADAYVNQHGADIVRLWVASQDFRNDITVSKERIDKVSEAYRVIRNTLRYQLSNLHDFDPTTHAMPDEALSGLDRWILQAFSILTKEIQAAYDRQDFHVVFQRLTQFAAVELSAVYHDIVKDRLYTDAANSTRRRSTQNTLHRIVTGLCKMLSPLLVFTADEAWQFIPAKPHDSVHLSNWPAFDFELTEAEQQLWTNLFDLRAQALPELEKARQAKLIGKSLEAKLAIAGSADELAGAAAHEETLRELLNVSQLEVTSKPGKTPLSFIVTHAEGQKCPRCWHWETDVGANPAHPTLCARCASVISAI